MSVAGVPKPAEKSVDHLALARAFGAKSQWSESEREFRVYRNQNPTSEKAVVWHAQALMRIGQPYDAALELQDFLRPRPNAIRAHELYAVLAATTLRDLILARSELEEVVRLAPQDFQAWRSLGDSATSELNFDRAVHAYQQATRLRPEDASVAASLGYAYAKLDLADKAEAEFRRAVKLANSLQGDRKDAAPIRATVYYIYGQYLLDEERPAESVTALTKALTYSPERSDTLYWRAQAYAKLKDYDRAEADGLEAFRLAPHKKESPLLLITTYRKKGNAEKAQQYADLAQKISDEEQAAASFGRSLRDALDKAEPLLREGRYADATAQYEALIKMLPTFYEAYFDLGVCYSQTGRPQEAEAAFRKYLSFQPVSGDGHAALGVLLLQQGRGTEAVPELTQAIQIDPSMVEARKALAGEYLRQSNPSAAITALRPARAAGDAELDVLLATALMQQGDTVTALSDVNRALRIDPNNVDAARLQQELSSKTAARKSVREVTPAPPSHN